MPILSLLLLAVPTPPDPAVAEDGWERLDREISALASETPGAGDVWITGFIRAGGIYAGEDLRDEGENGPRSFRLYNGRIGVAGTSGGHDFEVSLEHDGDQVRMVDAFARAHFLRDFEITAGRFLEPFLHSGMVRENGLLMIKRTINGDETDDRDVGVMLHGQHGPIGWYAAVQNGVNLLRDDMLFTGRATLDLFGGSAFRRREGARGVEEDERAGSVGVSGSDDQGVLNGTRYGLDAGLVFGALSLYFDTVRYDKQYDRDALGAPVGKDPAKVVTMLDPMGSGTFVPGNKAGTRPWSLTTGYLFGDGVVEVVGRFESFDDGDNTERMSGGFTWYPRGTDGMRFQLVYLDQDSDAPDSRLSGKAVELALTVDIDSRRD